MHNILNILRHPIRNRLSLQNQLLRLLQQARSIKFVRPTRTRSKVNLIRMDNANNNMHSLLTIRNSMINRRSVRNTMRLRLNLTHEYLISNIQHPNRITSRLLRLTTLTLMHMLMLTTITRRLDRNIRVIQTYQNNTRNMITTTSRLRMRTRTKRKHTTNISTQAIRLRFRRRLQRMMTSLQPRRTRQASIHQILNQGRLPIQIIPIRLLLLSHVPRQHTIINNHRH